MDKLCKHCRNVKDITNFVRSTITKSGYRGICKPCFNVYYQNRRKEKYELVRSYEKKYHTKRRLKYEYGLSIEEYEDMKVKYDNRCAICNSKEKLVIDHDHTTGKVRGLLCNKCNMGLGMFDDSEDSLREAIKYLRNNNGTN